MHKPKSSSYASTFYAKDLTIKATGPPKTVPENFHTDEFLKHIAFKLPTPHMLQIDYTNQEGWGKPYITEYKPLDIPPASAALHYGLQCYEGMKAFYQEPLDRIVMFRPDMNAKRFQNSSRAVALNSEFCGGELVKCIRELIRLDQDWVPRNALGSLYIRPTHIAFNINLGVAAPDRSKIFVMLMPVVPFFKSWDPIDLLVDPKYVRAWPGGTGQVKIGGNYGPTISVQVKAAAENSCAQCLWLFDDGQNDPIITEVGTMNFMMMWHRPGDGKLELVTPPLDDPPSSRKMDVILPGVTRDSLLTLARSWNWI